MQGPSTVDGSLVHSAWTAWPKIEAIFLQEGSWVFSVWRLYTLGQASAHSTVSGIPSCAKVASSQVFHHLCCM